MSDVEDLPQVVLATRSVIVKNDKLLVVQRSIGDRHAPGEWEFPGGKVDKGQTVDGTTEDEIFTEVEYLHDPLVR